MLKQSVSMSDGGRERTPSKALVPLPPTSQGQRTDPGLLERVERAAAASGVSPPILLPGAAALVLPVSLPLKTDRQRRAALPFAVEPYLAEPLDQVTLALGPQLAEQTWLCVAVNSTRLDALTGTMPAEGVCFPDTLAVPLPTRTGAWSLWCGCDTVHVRLADGTGLAMDRDAFADAWRAFGAPPAEVVHGTPPPGVAADRVPLTPVDPEIFSTDLRPGRASTGLRRFRDIARFAAGVALVAGLAQVALLRADVSFLATNVADRTASVQRQLDARGIETDATDAAWRVEAAISDAAGADTPQDPFLAQLARSLSALPSGSSVTLRDLRFDAATGALTVMLTAAGLQDLQSAETALSDAGISVTSGAASRSEAGAEMQLIIGAVSDAAI